MHRTLWMALLAVLGLSLTACGLSSRSLSFGLNDAGSGSTGSAPSSRRQPSGVALGGEPSVPREFGTRTSPATRVARADDKAPAGTFETAARGALSDRDYSASRLDAEKARDLINQYRADKGLKPLKLNSDLTEAAKAHARDLSKWDRISHYGSDGSTPWDRVKRTGYKARLAAENVGTGQASLDEVMKGWKESPGHNKNLLLPDAEHMGIALVQDPKTEFKTFWTLVLGSSM